MAEEHFFQEHFERRQQIVEVATLQEQMRSVMIQLAEAKAQNAQLGKQLDLVLEKLARADGGYRAFMWLGGFIVAANGFIVGWLTLFKKVP